MCVCTHPHPVLLSPVCCEVIHGDFHALALFELPHGVSQQIEVKGVRVVKVVVVTGGPSLLLWRQDLRTAKMWSAISTANLTQGRKRRGIMSNKLSLCLSFCLEKYIKISIIECKTLLELFYMKIF